MIESPQPVLTSLVFWGTLIGCIVLTFLIAVLLLFNADTLVALVGVGLLLVGGAGGGVALARNGSPALGWGLLMGVVAGVVLLAITICALVVWYADWINKNF
jgi:hypothetical protein